MAELVNFFFDLKAIIEHRGRLPFHFLTPVGARYAFPQLGECGIWDLYMRDECTDHCATWVFYLEHTSSVQKESKHFLNIYLQLKSDLSSLECSLPPPLPGFFSIFETSLGTRFQEQCLDPVVNFLLSFLSLKLAAVQGGFQLWGQKKKSP